MTRVPTIQEEFFKRYNPFFHIEFPSDFCDKTDLIKSLTGEHPFRGLDYNGNSHCFVESCLLSITARDSNIVKMKRVYDRLYILMPELADFGFYELAENIKEMLSCMKRAFESFERMNFEMNCDSLLQEMNINREYSGSSDLPF